MATEWQSKLDAVLIKTLDSPAANPAEMIEVVILLSDASSAESIDRDVRAAGGQVGRHTKLVPALSARIRLGSLEEIAGKKYVAQIEAERTHAMHGDP